MTLAGSSTDVPHYDIVVRSHSGEESVYRTSRPLFDGGADNVLGKGTRVWEAFRVDAVSGTTLGKPVVIKDSWVGQQREREGDILARIRESASVLDEADRALLEDALVNVVDHGDVYIAGKRDCTRSTEWESTKCFNDPHQYFARPNTTTVQAHYRLVYQEVCEPLRAETCLATAFSAVARICTSTYFSSPSKTMNSYVTALSLLHKCGWIHGDISTSNILMQDGKAKLSDFECAQKDGEVKEHDRVVSVSILCSAEYGC